MKSTMVKRHLHLTPKSVAAIKRLAAREGIPVAELVRRAIQEYLSKHDAK